MTATQWSVTGASKVAGKAGIRERWIQMAVVSCPKCSQMTAQGGIPAWQIIVAICFFPIGLLALLAGREPTRCSSCGHTWQS